MSGVTALVPMKHHSQRVPGKNYRPMAGKPLFHHILERLDQVPAVEEIVVNTDSPVIKEGLLEHFPAVRILDRPRELCGDKVSMNKIISYDLSQIEADTFLQTHTTNPLLRSESIAKAIQTYFSHLPDYDSLFSVTRLYTRLWDEKGHAINHDPGELIQTQNLPPVYEENSCMYIFSRASFQERNNRLGRHPYLFEIDAREAWDIDTELDFDIVSNLMSAQ